MTVGKVLAAIAVGLGFFIALGVAPVTPVVIGVAVALLGLAVIFG